MIQKSSLPLSFLPSFPPSFPLFLLLDSRDLSPQNSKQNSGDPSRPNCVQEFIMTLIFLLTATSCLTVHCLLRGNRTKPPMPMNFTDSSIQSLRRETICHVHMFSLHSLVRIRALRRCVALRCVTENSSGRSTE